jgi:hypothetical protein
MSDPLPLSSAMVDALDYRTWNMSDIEFNFELPSTVISQPLDPLVPIDVEFFNWGNDLTFANDSFGPTTNCKSAMIELSFINNIMSCLSPIAAQQVDLPMLELFSSTAPTLNMADPAGAAFDQFLHDMLSQHSESQVRDTFTLSQTPQAPPESMGAVSNDWSAYMPPAQDPVIIGSSGQLCGFIDLSTIPNVDPSMLQPLSSSSPADIIAQSEAAAKQSKLQQCYAHFQAAMKLQQEITTGNNS